MITKLYSLSSTPILNMHVRHEVFFQKNGREVVECAFGMIFSGISKLYTTFDTIHLYYTHKILVQRLEVPLVILQGY